jgi:hypothetical protein
VVGVDVDGKKSKILWVKRSLVWFRIQFFNPQIMVGINTNIGGDI